MIAIVEGGQEDDIYNVLTSQGGLDGDKISRARRSEWLNRIKT
jgi:hypothetical protein